jgi:hypothetical protein
MSWMVPAWLVVAVVAPRPGLALGARAGSQALVIPGDIMLGGLFPMHEQVSCSTRSHQTVT